MKINLKESLNKIDLATDNKYDLLNTFNSIKLSAENKKKLVEAIENNSIASVNKILHESEEQLYKVVLSSGATKFNFESALYKDEAEGIVDYYDGRWIDENGFEWDMYVEEDDDSTEHTMVDDSYDIKDDERAQRECVESLNEDLSSVEEIKQLDFTNNRVNNLRGIFSTKSFVKALNDVGLDKFKIRTSRLKNVSKGDLKDAWYDLKRNGWSMSIERDPSLSGFNEVYVFEKITNESLDKQLTEASYGGAYDIEDDMFFTKEEIVELANKVCSLLQEKFGYDYEVVEVGMESTTELYLCIQDIHGVEEESMFRIDMRKIRKPSDLFKYAKPIAGRLAEKFEDEYQYYNFDKSLKESKLSGYNMLSSTLKDGGDTYALLRKTEDGKTKWAAAKYVNGVPDENNIFEITYKQARGFEPLTDTGKMSRKLGKILLPRRENLKEDLSDLDLFLNTPADTKQFNDETFKALKNLVSEYKKDLDSLDQWASESEKEPFVKKWYKLADKCKEIAKNGIRGITGYGRLNDFIKLKIVDLARSVDNTFPWYTRNNLAKFNKLESLQEKLNNNEKNTIIKSIINAEEDELQKIVNEVYFYDRALYLKLRHFVKKNSLNDKKDYLIKVLQDSLEESLTEDTVKQNGKWVNKGDTGKTHGEFKTKKAADQQRKAMYAQGFKGECLEESDNDEDSEDKVAVFTKGIDGKTYYHGFMDRKEADKHYPDRLKESFDDETDFETDFDDGEVEEGNVFFADGTDWVWEERIAGPLYLDFDKWAVWSARESVDIRDFIIGKNDNGGWDIDKEAYIEAIKSKPIVYFIVDEDTGFIDWGPVENEIEAKDFLNSKQDDWENDDYYGESLKEDFDDSTTFEIYYDDIDGEKADYYFEVPYIDVLEFLANYAEDEEDAPQDEEELLKYIDKNFDRLYNEYEYKVLDHFYEDAEMKYQSDMADRAEYIRDTMRDRDI